MPYPHPATEETHAHYRKLKDSAHYLPLDQMRDKFVHLIHARNSYIGIWIAEEKGLVLLRQKFDRLFLDVEYHWDKGAPFGTAQPFVQLCGPVTPGTEREVLEAIQQDIPFADYMARTRPWSQ
jgi:hypothetical protein